MVMASFDRSPVAEPDGLAVTARVSDLDSIVRAAGTWVHLPLPRGEELVRLAAGDSLGGIVDLGRPIDAAVRVTLGPKPKPQFAVAVHVRSYEEAKNVLGARYKLVPLTNGTIRVEGLGKPDLDNPDAVAGEEDEPAQGRAPRDACALMPSVGPTNARLVCGDWASVEALGPWLARTAPNEKTPSNVRVQLRLAMVRQAAESVRPMVSMLAAGALNVRGAAKRELIDAALGDVLDFAGDVDTMTLDADTFDKGPEAARAKVRVSYARSNSLIAKMAISRSLRASQAPQAFWQLPRDVDTAFFGSGVDDKLLARPVALVRRALEETLEDSSMAEADRRVLAEWAGEVLALSGDVDVYARGVDGDRLVKAAQKADEAADSDWGEARKGLEREALGWHVVHVSQPFARVSPRLREIAALFARPSFRAWATKHASKETAARVRLAPVPAGLTLPRGTVHLEVVAPSRAVVAPGAKAQPKAAAPTELHVYALPEGEATWLAFGLDARSVAVHAQSALASAGSVQKLSKREGLEALRDAKLVSGGFVSLRSAATLGAMGGRKERKAAAQLAAAPGRGQSAVLVTATAQPSASPGGGVSETTISVPLSLVEELVTLAMSR